MSWVDREYEYWIEKYKQEQLNLKTENMDTAIRVIEEQVMNCNKEADCLKEERELIIRRLIENQNQIDNFEGKSRRLRADLDKMYDNRLSESRGCVGESRDTCNIQSDNKTTNKPNIRM